MNKRKKEQYLRLKEIFNRYKLSNNDMKNIYKIIKPIYNHKEFQKRMEAPYYHHGSTMVGEHILGDTILVYLNCKHDNKSKEVTRRAVLISMFHDLYCTPWKLSKRKKYMVNYHAYTHSIEAIVNAITWFPYYFEDMEDAKIIIDGVIHHMYPLPVRANSSLELEIENIELLKTMDDRLQKIIYLSLKPCFTKNYSLRKTFYYEGRVLIKVDKLITLKRDLKGFKIREFMKTIYGLLNKA